MPGPGIVKWQEDVMQVNIDTWFNDRQNFQKKNAYVGILQNSMGTIKEEDVTRLKIAKEREVALLQWLTKNLVAKRIDLGSRRWVNRTDNSMGTVGLFR